MESQCFADAGEYEELRKFVMKLILAYEGARIVTGFRVTNFLSKLNTCVTTVETVEKDLVLLSGSINQS